MHRIFGPRSGHQLHRRRTHGRYTQRSQSGTQRARRRQQRLTRLGLFFARSGAETGRRRVAYRCRHPIWARRLHRQSDRLRRHDRRNHTRQRRHRRHHWMRHHPHINGRREHRRHRRHHHDDGSSLRTLVAGCDGTMARTLTTTRFLAIAFALFATAVTARGTIAFVRLATLAFFAAIFLFAARSILAAILGFTTIFGDAAFDLVAANWGSIAGSEAALRAILLRPHAVSHQSDNRRDQRGLPISHQHKLSLLLAERVEHISSARHHSEGGRRCQ